MNEIEEPRESDLPEKPLTEVMPEEEDEPVIPGEEVVPEEEFAEAEAAATSDTMDTGESETYPDD
jgi:hypothetical protein